jgi:hypothetical protein
VSRCQCACRARECQCQPPDTHHCKLRLRAARANPTAVSWISSNQSLRNRSSTRSAPAQTVRGSDVWSRRHNVGFFNGNLFAEATCCSDGCWLWILRRMNLRRESCGREGQRDTQKCESNHTSAEDRMNFQIRVSCPSYFLLFSVLRESVLSYDSSPGSRSLI